jgi:hypothetical protein
MTKTPLEAAESQFRSISITEKNGQFAAIRKVLQDRERKLRVVQKAARLQNRPQLNNGV